ncbi:hypothetical protein F5X68DRAFT_206200 [Plectosphaerella plurivora]|uniref:Secreted protein n=1 Tax=Plectosphaerella plurivora TaxID=936078 RepID=A0A9P8VBJ6_9PEZI|nr:hypothetical protein F5X68DRAFT_206200 [Plectosphaerella plurivora]
MQIFAATRLVVLLVAAVGASVHGRNSGGCNANNCARAVSGTNAAKAPSITSRKQDCASFMLVTVTPAPRYTCPNRPEESKLILLGQHHDSYRDRQWRHHNCPCQHHLEACHPTPSRLTRCYHRPTYERSALRLPLSQQLGVQLGMQLLGHQTSDHDCTRAGRHHNHHRHRSRYGCRCCR